MSKKPPPLSRRFDQLANDILDRINATSEKAPSDDDSPIPLLV
jgi:chromosome partitioning protein